MDRILHFNAPGLFDKPVLVVPEAIWTQSHLINEKIWFSDMGNFSDPGGGKLKERFESVSDDHSGNHFIRNGMGDLKIKPNRSDLLKIMRVGKEFPGRFKGYRQKLAAFKPI
ncbi:MAG: hypothetical protein PVI58_10965 [Desulfobacterales bacterium]